MPPAIVFALPGRDARYDICAALEATMPRAPRLGASPYAGRPRHRVHLRPVGCSDRHRDDSAAVDALCAATIAPAPARCVDACGPRTPGV